MGELDNIHWLLSVHLLRRLVLVAAPLLVGPERKVNRILDKIDRFNAVSWKNCHKSDPNGEQACMFSAVCNKYLTNSFSICLRLFDENCSQSYFCMSAEELLCHLTSVYKRHILLNSQVCKMYRIFKRFFIKLKNKQCRKTVVYRYKQQKQAHDAGCPRKL